MFYRGNVQRRKLLKPRNHKKKKAIINQPEWDNTVQDLTVHAASPEELLRRQIRRKSKNADIAHREIMAKKKGIPVDLMLSPGQVELEMKKLAVLREVLYDHNDFNEVLKKTDQTMASVKNIFHDSTARKSGHPNVTLAPGCKLPPPVDTEPEQPSRLDALSDSVMDNQALNDHNSSADESESEDGNKFESKVDYERFLSLLKDSMNNTRNQTVLDTGTITPEKDDTVHEKMQGALNCTEEVKRTLSRISSIKDAEDNEKAKGDQSRKIDQVISGLTKDASKLEKRLNHSLNPTIPTRPMPNLAPSNMTYDDLQGAMENVGRKLSAFEKRTGRVRDGEKSTAPCGLAGFTVTLIDSVTRLTTYVNEGEIRGQELEASVESLKCKLEHQVKVNEALALELVNTQKVIKQEQEETAALKQELQQDMLIKDKTWTEEKEGLERKIFDLVKVVTDLENKLIISEHSLEEDKIDSWNNLSELQLMDAKFEKNVHSKEEEEKEEQALKNDMVHLLTALKTQNNKVTASQNALPPSYSTLLNGGAPEASKTIASVESHLRHLQLQHAEAQQRMNELTKQAQMYPIPSMDDCLTTESMMSHPQESHGNFATESMMSHPQESHGNFATESMMSYPQKSHATFATDSMMSHPQKSHATFATESMMSQPRKSHDALATESMMSHPQKSHATVATDSVMSHPQKSHATFATDSMMSYPQKSDATFATESMMSRPQKSHATFATDSVMSYPQNSHATFATESMMSQPRKSYGALATESMMSHPQNSHATFATDSMMSHPQKSHGALATESMMSRPQKSHATFATDSVMSYPQNSHATFATDSMMSYPQNSHATFATESMMSQPRKSHGALATESMMSHPQKSHATFATDSMMSYPQKSHGALATESMMSHPQNSHATFATDSMMSYPQKSHATFATNSMMSYPQKSDATFATDSMMSYPQKSHGALGTESMMSHPQKSHGALATESLMSQPRKSHGALATNSMLSHPQKSHGALATESLMSQPRKSHGALATNSMLSHPQKSHGALATESLMSQPRKSHGALATNSMLSHPQKSHGALATESLMSQPRKSHGALATNSMLSHPQKSHGALATDPRKYVTLPIRRIPQRAMQPQQSNINPSLGSAYYSSPPTQDQGEQEEPTKESATQGFSFDRDSDPGSFKMLEEDTSETSVVQSTCSSAESVPEVAEQQQAVLSSIQQTQLSLEDRISELNKQHNQAQERLQKLVARRRQEKAKKKVQMSLPSLDMLGTPHESHPFLPMPEASTEWFSLSNNLDSPAQ